MSYELSVFFPVVSGALAGALAVHVYVLEIAKPLEWVKANANELAAKCVVGKLEAPCALWVKEVK